jgi:hypothetical protein
MFRHVLTSLMCVLSFACIPEPAAVEPAGTTLAIFSIAPSRAQRGDAVRISGAGFDGLRRSSFPASFNGASAVPEDRSDSLLILRVPFDASTGPVVLFTETDSVVGPVFAVASSCDKDACIGVYLGPPLTEQQAWTLDCFLRYVKWSGEVRSDTVILTHNYCVGDDMYLSITLRLWGPDPFTGNVDGVFIGNLFPWNFTYPLKGQIYLQSWDRGGIISGKASWWLSDFRDWRDFVFWYDFGR